MKIRWPPTIVAIVKLSKNNNGWLYSRSMLPVGGHVTGQDFTSIQQRIKAACKGEQPSHLLPFVGNEHKHMPKGLMFTK